MEGEAASPGFRFTREEISGSLGDLGTFLPLTLGYITYCGLSPAPVFFFAGLWNVVTGILFRLPVPVQPMKAIAAVAIAEGMTPGEVVAAGILMGGIVFLIGVLPVPGRLLSLAPRPVVRGIQLGIGLKLFLTGVEAIRPLPVFAWDSHLTGGVAVSLIVLSYVRQKVPAALILFLFGFLLLGISKPWLFGGLNLQAWRPEIIIPSSAEWWSGFTRGTVAQLPLTLLNSVVAVCALSGDLFPGRKIRETKMAQSVGTMNLISCWFGGMPMCHGSGGLAAQYHFGARTGGSVLFLGGMKMALGVAAATALLVPLQNFPHSILGALLVFSGLELSLPARDLAGREEFFVALLTAGLILSVNVTAGFLVGILFWGIFGGKKNGDPGR
ncbi:MAG: putative sulfate/molybdate transporter [Thermodesulfobacteriota bacterium]|nr:putative sulfate/molybdate transporter [Thermodesulfobacteriota bacterium]